MDTPTNAERIRRVPGDAVIAAAFLTILVVVFAIATPAASGFSGNFHQDVTGAKQPAESTFLQPDS